MRTLLLLLSLWGLSSCTGMPDRVKPVKGFELNRYLGSWYEIARLDHSFEAGLSQVTANYSMREDGGVSVLNRGFSADENTWREAEGKAYFVEDSDTGYLKVSFFGPFYGSYVIFELDKQNYQYAFVSGPDTDYLWLLARTPQVEPEVIDKFEQMAKDRGFNTDQLIYVDQQVASAP
ncbi:lipocalin family protein [Bowmanella sp. Y26]|uniref:lipocalin family protein n=1 Tax=Bowmanella yangjiangensis TaxID=2811230 RepID=UPI001BDCD38F|nr:lipocalin family protein [Bowmanella yangjiangensis]